MRPFRPFAAAVLAAGAAAQQLDWTVTTPTGLAASASLGTPVVQTIPPGPVGATGSLLASAGPSASAAATWGVESGATLARFSTASQVVVAPGAPAGSSASVGVHELLLTLTTTAPVAVELRVAGTQAHAAGAAPGPLSVDVGDDGVADYAFENGAAFAATLTIASALPLRIRTGCSVTTGAASSALTITATPANALLVQTAVLGCINLAPALAVTPSFAGSGVRIVADASPLIPAVVLLGLSAQPLLLPSFQGTPCLVLPSPHVLLLRVDATPVDIALPAAVRPVTFWTQSVLLAPQQLLTSAGFRVLAQ